MLTDILYSNYMEMKEQFISYCPAPPVKDMTFEEQDKFIEYLSTQPIAAQFICLLYLETGCRTSEGLALTMGDLRRGVQCKTPCLYIPTLKQRRTKMVKGVRLTFPPRRLVPIRMKKIHPAHSLNFFSVCLDYVKFREKEKDEAQCIIWPYCPLLKQFDIKDKKQDVSRNCIHQTTKKIFTAIGCPELSTHSLRHTFAVNRLKEGCPLPVLQKLMGHADLKNLAIYLAPRQEDLFKAMGQ